MFWRPPKQVEVILNDRFQYSLINIAMEGGNFLTHPAFQGVIASIRETCKASNVDDTHGVAHALKIASLTEKALQFEPVEEQTRQDLIYAALLHDIDDHKYFQTENYANAVAALQAAALPPQRIANIVHMIALVSFSKNGNTISPTLPTSCYLPRYIDRTEAIGLQGLHRSLMYALEKQAGNPIYCESTPRPASEEELRRVSRGRDAEYMKRGGHSVSVVDHIFDKLMHIELPAAITNSFLVELYRQKQSEMIQFVLKHARNGYVDYEKELQEEYLLNGQLWESIQ